MPPPLNPVPAVTAVISPVLAVAFSAIPPSLVFSPAVNGFATFSVSAVVPEPVSDPSVATLVNPLPPAKILLA